MFKRGENGQGRRHSLGCPLGRTGRAELHMVDCRLLSGVGKRGGECVETQSTRRLLPRCHLCIRRRTNGLVFLGGFMLRTVVDSDGRANVALEHDVIPSYGRSASIAIVTMDVSAPEAV